MAETGTTSGGIPAMRLKESLYGDVRPNPMPPAGSFFISEYEGPWQVIEYICPCGCGKANMVTIYSDGRLNGEGRGWFWNGDRDRPTLSPSLQQHTACRWHGHLGGPQGERPGVWVTC